MMLCNRKMALELRKKHFCGIIDVDAICIWNKAEAIGGSNETVQLIPQKRGYRKEAGSRVLLQNQLWRDNIYP